MSRIRFTTKVAGLSEEVEALATSIARFLGRPISADDLSTLSAYYSNYMIWANKLAHCKTPSYYKIYIEYYEMYKKQFYQFLKLLRDKYDTQKEFDFSQTTTHLY